MVNDKFWNFWVVEGRDFLSYEFSTWIKFSQLLVISYSYQYNQDDFRILSLILTLRDLTIAELILLLGDTPNTAVLLCFSIISTLEKNDTYLL